MKVSIITVAFNAEKTIEDTIKSVLNQTYPNIEYITIDGGSKDQTLNIARRYKEKITTIISEKDNGIYDAMNKGIKLATGEVVGILNSDDVYAGSDVVETIVKEIEDKDAVWGDLVYVKNNDISKVLRSWKSSPYQTGKFQSGWHPPHPTFFVRKEVYEKYGFFREDMPIAADYELMLRFLEKNKISSGYIPKVLVKMRTGGESNRNIFKIISANLQCLKAFKLNDLKVNPLIFFFKPLGKITQYFKPSE